MACPVIVDVQGGIGVFGDRRTKKARRRVVDMENDFEVQSMKGIELFGRMSKGIRIELERAVARVPAVSAIAGAEVDEGVARELFFARCVRFEAAPPARRVCDGIENNQEPIWAALRAGQ